MFDDQDNEASDLAQSAIDLALIIVFVILCIWISSYAAGWFFGGTV